MSEQQFSIRRAILSVSDKAGIVELAKFLTDRNVEILSTGGTARHLEEAGITVTSIAKWSGAPEILGGRVKTLTPKVFGAILGDRDKQDHLDDLEKQQIPPIDLVVVNLYPFEATISRGEVTLAEAIEQIDIGGPSMLRASAKNYRHVLPLCDPSLYAEFMSEAAAGAISDEFRMHAAVEVFRKTSQYDAMIADYLARHATPKETTVMPDTMIVTLRKRQDLRYGENPQQMASFYTASALSNGGFTQLQGKELSYNNLIDLDAAYKLATAFADPACAIIKHTNPCGCARGLTIDQSLKLALETDPVSAFGGIIGVNREFTAEAAHLVASMFLEVIIAPSFSEEALDMLQKKKNLRLIAATDLSHRFEVRTAAGGLLLQSADRISGIENWKSVTRRAPTPEEIRSLEFAWIVCAHVKSNAIVLARESQAVGVGAGQMSRVDSAKISIMKSILPTKGSVGASDAFFPFRDGLDILAQAGVTAVVQPGGSVRDDEVIAAADEHGIAMVFTGERHFKH